MNKTNEELVELIQNKNDEKKNIEALYLQNTCIVKKMASKYTKKADYEDLCQECFLALYEAIKSYEPNTGKSFLSYWCSWMRWHLYRYINGSAMMIRIPSGVMLLLSKYRALVSSGVELTKDQICSCLGITIEKLADLLRAEQLLSVVSLDAPIDTEEGSESTLSDFIADDLRPFDEVDEKIYNQQLKDELWAIVDSLSASLSSVLHKRYEEGLSLEAIAHREGRSTERIRQRQEKALRQLRQPQYSKRLIKYIDEECYSAGLKKRSISTFQRTGTSSTEAAAFKIMELERALIRKKKEGTFSTADLVQYNDEVIGSMKNADSVLNLSIVNSEKDKND